MLAHTMEILVCGHLDSLLLGLWQSMVGGCGRAELLSMCPGHTQEHRSQLLQFSPLLIAQGAASGTWTFAAPLNLS